MVTTWQTISALWPEAILGAAATCIFVAGAFTRNRAWWAFVAIISYVVAAIPLAAQGVPWNVTESVLTGPVSVDPMSLGLRWLGLLVGFIFTLIAAHLADRDLASDVFGCLMLVGLGIMLVASANDLVLLFLAFELISIPTYVLLFVGRRDLASHEATMKYFFLSLLSSALLLYGFSFLFGLGGTTLIAGTEATPGIREALLGMGQAQDGPLAPLAPLALVLIVAGLGFKLAVAPLQFYAPDVYQGTTSTNAGLLAVAPKIAGVVGLVRLIVVAMPITADFAWQLALVIAVLTMTIGNVCALWQRNVRRLMAYSSIAHGGYILIGLAAAAAASAATARGQTDLGGGVTAMLFYVLVYALASMGTFAALAYLGTAGRDVNDVEELAGLGRSQPLVAGAIAVFMFSLAGLPPLAGFWGKLNLFTSAIQLATTEPATGGVALWFTVLAVVGVLNAAIAAAYYLRVVAVMFFQPALEPVAAAGGRSAWAATLLCGLLVIGIGALPGRWLDVASQSENALQSGERTVRAAIPRREGPLPQPALASADGSPVDAGP